MKKALLLLSFVHLLAACTNDIEILPNDESQKLIVNALINANKTNNAIFLALSGYHEPQVVKNGIIHLYINNVLSETISECTYRPNNDSPLDYQNYFYQISSRFKTGDQVRIEVETKDGKYKANAEATVYEPIEIIKADTIESNHSLSETSESLWIYQATKWKIKLQTPTTNHSQYYRVNIKQTYTYRLTNRKTLQDSTAISTQWECSGYYDTALMDGKPAKVQTALKKMYPKADGIAWSQDGGYYCADFMMNGYEKNVWFNAQGQWQMTQTEIGRASCRERVCLYV